MPSSKSLVFDPASVSFAERVFSIEEAAAHLHLCRTMIFHLVASGHLKSFKVGKRRLFTGAELQRFVQSATSETTQ